MRLFLALLLMSGTLQAATVNVEVKGPDGAPLADAIAYALPKGPAPALRKREVNVQQVDKKFVPQVTVVQTGSPVSFPNRDPIRHHVYSFSPAKPFELKLYAGTPASPIVFDKAGEVVLGCNIHDQMLGYILVVDTPYFGKSGADGKVKIESLPAGDYDVMLWHPALALPAPNARSVKLRADETAALSYAVALRPSPPKPIR
jgi:plastocyanin